MAKARAAFTSAPVYVYQMNLIVPYMGGLALWHCGEIPFVFRNVELEPMLCTADYSEKVQDVVSSAWLNFMEKGAPGSSDMRWDTYTKEVPDIMFLDESSGQTRESDQKLLEMLSKTRPPFLA